MLINTGMAAKINVAAVQLTAKQQTLAALENDIDKYAVEAKSQGADIILFPEDDMLNTIYDKPWSKESLVELASSYKDFKKFVGLLSKQLNMTIVAGSTTQIKDGKLYNTALIGLPDGKVIEQDKIYLTPGERKVGYDGSGHNILVLDTSKGRVAILVCYTSEFADISQELSKIQPDVILVPSYTDDIYGMNRVHTAIRMLSIQNYSYGAVVGMVSNRDINNLEGADGVAQMLFTNPQQVEFPIGYMAKGKFNHEDMLIQSFDIDKLHKARLKYTAYPNKDTVLANKNIGQTIIKVES